MMDLPRDTVEEATESFNPKEQGPSAFDPSKSVRSDRDIPIEPTEALLKISHDMAWVLERLTAPKLQLI